jgi:hypothetical protein
MKNKNKTKILPKTIEVAGKTVDIDFMEEDDFESWGTFNEDDNLILIHPNAVEKNLEWDSVAHEMIHAALRYSGIFYDTLRSDMKAEEAVVRCIENIFLPAYDNLMRQKSK